MGGSTFLPDINSCLVLIGTKLFHLLPEFSQVPSAELLREWESTHLVERDKA